jgi:hypothetical protein
LYSSHILDVDFDDSCTGGWQGLQTEKTSKQTMNDLLACLWEMCHTDGMNITNLPPMGNAEEIAYPSAWGRTSVRPFFFDPVPDAGDGFAPS